MNDDEARQHLLSGTEKLYQITDTLNSARKVAAETEEIGNQTLSELEAQRKGIQRAHDQLPEVNDSVTRGKIIMKSIRRRMLTNRFLCWCFCFIILVLISLIIYLSYFHH